MVQKSSQGKKILIATGLFPPEGGGPATYSKTLLERLPAYGFSVSVLPYREVRGYPKFLRHLAYFFKTVARIHKFKPNVVYAQDPISVGLPSALAAKLMRKPFVLKMVGDYAWEQAGGRFRYTKTVEEFQKDTTLPLLIRIMRTLERWVARQAVKVIVPSKYLGKIVREWGVERKRISVIYNGVDIEPVGLKQVIRGLLKFKGKLVISVSRLVPWKGFDTLIRIHAELCKRIPDLRLLIVGDGPEMDRLVALSEDLGVADSVVFTGNVDRAVALRYMRAADVFVLNTRYEGFSHLLLEAASVGVPIITTKVGGNPELIEDNVHGYLVKPNDTKTLTHRIEKLLNAPESRARLAGNAKNRVDRFSIARMVEETAMFFKHI
ncbi:MAG: glycosyltransferase family 4 protein [Patescibacteria group bacterium UBA2163]